MRWLPLLLLAGCTLESSKTDTSPKPARDPLYSADVPTSEMVPSMSAESYGDGIRIYGALLARGVFVTLSEGDFLTATIGSERIVLVRQQNPDPGKVRYEASFPPVPSAEVTIEFHRAHGTPPAPIKVPIPPAFEVTSQVTTVVKGEEVAFKVTPPPVFQSSSNSGPLRDGMRVVVIGPCVADNDGYPANVTEDGSGSFSTSLVRVNGADGCDVKFLVRRQVIYRAPEGYSTSTLRGIEAMQGRTFTGKMVPY